MQVSTKFEDVFAFGGPAPETINGRLAMLGFVSAVGVEIVSERGLFYELAHEGFPLFLGSALLLRNGRFAMVGVVALAFTEFYRGGPLV